MDNVSSIRLHPHTVSLIWALSVCIIELFGTVECKGLLTLKHVQSTLVILTLLNLNNRLSRSKNLAPVLTWKSNSRLQNIVEKRRNCSLGAISPLFHNIFIYL